MKNLKNLGKALSKAEQQTISGGTVPQGPCYLVSTRPGSCGPGLTEVICSTNPYTYGCKK